MKTKGIAFLCILLMLVAVILLGLFGQSNEENVSSAELTATEKEAMEAAGESAPAAEPVEELEETLLEPADATGIASVDMQQDNAPDTFSVDENDIDESAAPVEDEQKETIETVPGGGDSFGGEDEEESAVPTEEEQDDAPGIVVGGGDAFRGDDDDYDNGSDESGNPEDIEFGEL